MCYYGQSEVDDEALGEEILIGFSLWDCARLDDLHETMIR